MSAPKLGRARTTHRIVDGVHQPRLSELVVAVNAAVEAYNATKDKQGRVGSADAAEARAEVERLSQEHDALLAEASREFTLVALPRRKWEAAKGEHPARKVDGDDGKRVTHPLDALTDVNTATFFDAVLIDSIIDPTSDEYDPRPMFTERAAEDFMDSLSTQEWRDLCNAIWALNEHGPGIPTSSISSSLLRLIDGESKQQNDSASPSPASRVGSRARGTSSETGTDDPAPSPTRGRLSSSASRSGTSRSGT